MTPKKVDQDLLRRLRVDIDEALADVRTKYGLSKLAAGRASFDPRAGSFTFKVEGAVSGGLDANAARYEQTRGYAKRWPALGTVILWGGSSLVIAGEGRGGAIYVTGKDDGKTYTIKRAQFARVYGEMFDSEKGWPTRKEAGEEGSP